MKKKLESLSLDKFQSKAVSKFDLNATYGGHNTGGGGHDIGQGVWETYTSDTTHSNGGVSWDTNDFVFCEGVD